MIYLFVFILLIIMGVDVFYPFYSRKYIQFGISIPEPYVHEKLLDRSRKQYSLFSCMMHIVIIVLFSMTTFQVTDDKAVIHFLIAMTVMGLISFTMYSIFHIRTKKLVYENNWFEKVTIVHVTRFDARLNEKIFEPFLFIVPMIVTVVILMITLQWYDTIPDIIATHWGIDGKPDAWAEKSYVSVLMLPIILLFIQLLNVGIAHGISKSSIKVTAQATEQSLEREIEHRKQTSYFLAVTNIAVTILMLFLHVSTTLIKIENVTYFILLCIVYLFVISVGLFMYAKKVYHMNEKFDHLETDESISSDDHLWKWGLFYVNKNDPSILVEKRVGIGWTLNFARPGTYILLFVILVVPLLSLFFL